VAVLEGDIEVWKDLRRIRHQIDQAGGDRPRVGVHQPDPGHVRHSLHQFFQQVGQAVLEAQIVAVIGQVLGDQNQLFDTHVAQAAGFIEDRRRRPADCRAFDHGDGAEGARAAAAIGDLEVGAGPLAGGAQHAALVRADGGRLVRQVVERFRVAAPAQATHQIDDVHPAPGADHAVQAGHFLHQGLPVTLRQAAGGDQQLAVALERGQLAQRLDRFLAGALDEPAGVDDQHPGPGRIVHPAQARAVQKLGHTLGIDRILGAAEAEQVVAMAALRHRLKSFF